MKENGNLYKKVFSLFAPYPRHIILIFACITISSITSMLLPILNKYILDKGLLVHNYSLLIILTLSSLALVILEQAIGIFETSQRAYVQSLISYNLNKSVLKCIFKIDMQCFNRMNSVEITNNACVDTANISRVADKTTFYILTSVFRMVSGIISLSLISWKLTFLAIIILPLRYFIVKFLSKRRLTAMNKLIEYQRDFAAWFGDTIQGVKEIKLWGLDKIKVKQFNDKQRSIIKQSIYLNILDKINEMSESLFYQIITCTAYLIGGYFFFNSSLTIGDLFAFITYSIYIATPVAVILNLGYSFTDIIPSAKRFFGFIDMAITNTESQGKRRNISKNEETKGKISFEDISFAYKNGNRALDGISFKIKEGEKVAFIGSNGSGKSTLVNILLGFYKPDKGSILIDGKNVNEIDLKDYRNMISAVCQDFYIFNTSVEANITMADKIKRAKAYETLKENRLDKFFDDFPEAKYQVGTNGAMLSGGQRQRLAIMRALAKPSNILVLDEATSHLDTSSEDYINYLLSDDRINKTVIVITHRQEILKKLDRIFIIDKGRISHSGTHEELLKQSGFYKNMIEGNMDLLSGRKVVYG